MMTILITLIVGIFGGFFTHIAAMNVSFKKRTIDNKIKVFDAIIVAWVKMRNFIFANHPSLSSEGQHHALASDFDQMYGNTQQYIGEAVLICEDEQLLTDLNELNERIYRTNWFAMDYDAVNVAIEKIKIDALLLVARMRNDIKRSTRFELSDISHAIAGVSNRR